MYILDERRKAIGHINKTRLLQKEIIHVASLDDFQVKGGHIRRKIVTERVSSLFAVLPIDRSIGHSFTEWTEFWNRQIQLTIYKLMKKAEDTTNIRLDGSSNHMAIYPLLEEVCSPLVWEILGSLLSLSLHRSISSNLTSFSYIVCSYSMWKIIRSSLNSSTKQRSWNWLDVYMQVIH